MAISISKIIPKHSTIGGYNDLEGGGSGFTTSPITINLTGINNFTANTKKSLIKINIPKSSSSWSGSGASDVGDNTIKDLKRIEDTMKMRGWLEDDAVYSAWEKAFQLRAMCASGGPINTLTIDNISFDSSTVQVYLEEVTFIVHPGQSRANNKLLNELSGDGNARVEVDLAFYMGDPR